jgi:hypothetical protein
MHAGIAFRTLVVADRLKSSCSRPKLFHMTPPHNSRKHARKSGAPEAADWSALVQDIVESANDSDDAKLPGKPTRGPARSTVVFLGVLALGLVTYNAWYLTRTVDTLEVEVSRSGMMDQVALAAREAEAFRRRTGHLPQEMELGGLIRDGMSYEVLGDFFRIGATEQGLAVSYHSSVDLELWLTGSRRTRQ